MQARAKRASILGVVFLAAAAATLGIALRAPAQVHAPGYAWDDPDWRFRLTDRPVKVVVLAGSIGVFQDHPYTRLLHEWCVNAEIRNLAMVGYGGSQLYYRFRREVLENPRMPLGSEDLELWLMWGGGLNSASNGHRTNHYIRRAFRDAHRRDMHVVGLTLTPWGSLDDTDRWSGQRGIDIHTSTRQIVDFVMARSTPREGLGLFAESRDVPADAPWQPEEKADIRVDLFDSPLRDRDAAPQDLDAMRRQLRRDSQWRYRTHELGEEELAERLERDAATLASLPTFFMRREYRGFDDVHPNREGHRVMAERICPRLPASWGCTCDGHASVEPE